MNQPIDSTYPRVVLSDPPTAAAAASAVRPEHLAHHLGLPVGHRPDAEIERGIDDAVRWYSDHADPSRVVIEIGVVDATDGEVRLVGGGSLACPTLARRLAGATGGSVLVGAFSAGEKVDAEITRRWRSGDPFATHVLAALAAAVAEDFRDRSFEGLRNRAAEDDRELSAHSSPGYHDWDVRENRTLASLLAGRTCVCVSDNGGLKPTRSTLAVVAARSSGTRTRDASSTGEGLPSSRIAAASTSPSTPTDARSPTSAFPARALDKWSQERLTVEELSSARRRAVFRFDGTTCGSPGRALALEYRIEFSVDPGGRARLEALECGPADDDRGHQAMCALLVPDDESSRLWSGVPNAPGRTLDEALDALPAHQSAGCLCRAEYRTHKWRAALETLRHYLHASAQK